MPTFRKRPVEVEARLFDGDNGAEIAVWCGGRSGVDVKPSDHTDERPYVDIPTLEGTMTADRGDWIIRGVAGEFYPCKPEIFAETYEQVA